MVINSTVGWNGYLFLFLYTCNVFALYATENTVNLLDTFYSLNANRNATSAGNLSSKWRRIGSSETIRGNTYLKKINNLL